MSACCMSCGFVESHAPSCSDAEASPVVGDYVRWEHHNPAIGNWIEGELRSVDSSHVGNNVAILVVRSNRWPVGTLQPVTIDGNVFRKIARPSEVTEQPQLTCTSSVHHFGASPSPGDLCQCGNRRAGGRQRSAAEAYSEIASHNPDELCSEFGFDRLKSDYRQHTRSMHLAADRGDRYAAIEIPAREMCARKPAELLREFCWKLADALGGVPPVAATKPIVTFGDVRTSPGIVVSVKAPDATPQARQPVIRITNHFTSDDALRTMRESQAETAKAIVRLRAERAAVDELRRSPPDPLDVIIDGNTLRELLVIDEVQRRGEVTPHVSFTPAQRAAVSAHWSAELRRKVAASAEAERRRVVLDTEDE